jgi:hypothetical protein
MAAVEGGRQPSAVTYRPSLEARVRGAEGVCLRRNYSVSKYQESRSKDTAPTHKGKGNRPRRPIGGEEV